jgi:hypothetical protein
MLDRRVQRGWPLLMSVVLGMMWWWTGTDVGHAWLLRSGH